MVFGSNLPLSYPGAAIEPIRNAQVSEDEKRLIFGGNLRRLLES